MQLRDALSDLREIRAQLDRARGLRGLKSTSVGVSGLLAIVGAMMQLAWQADSSGSLSEFLTIWLGVAVASATAVVAEIGVRSWHRGAWQVWRTYRKLVCQIAPSLFVGAILTAAIVFSVRAAWMLPGMWALVYSLGLFACLQHLPRAAIWAAFYFLVGGTVCLWHSFALQDLAGSHFSAWYMVLLFGGGQLLLGWILYWTLERESGKV